MTVAGNTDIKEANVNILDKGNVIFLYLICGYVNNSTEINKGDV